MARKINYGDTLSGIAAENNTTVNELMKLNPNITNPNLIRAGEYINLPGDAAQTVPSSAGSTNLAGANAQNGTSLMKSPWGGVSDQTYTNLNKNVTDYTPYQEATQSLQQQAEALHGDRTYTSDLASIVDQIKNREKFSYDFSQDPMFMNMLASSMAQGKTAMKDSIAQSSALTGGYGNTWAQTAGQQAYNQYIQSAYENLPAYYQLALDAYNQEENSLMQKFSMLYDLDNTEYARLVDLYNVANDAVSRASNEYNSFMDNNQFMATLGNNEYWKQTEFEYEKEQNRIAAEAAAEKLRLQQVTAAAYNGYDPENYVQAVKYAYEDGRLEQYIASLPEEMRPAAYEALNRAGISDSYADASANNSFWDQIFTEEYYGGRNAALPIIEQLEYARNENEARSLIYDGLSYLYDNNRMDKNQYSYLVSYLSDAYLGENADSKYGWRNK